MPTATAPPPLITLLAHEVRWHLVMLLARSDHSVQELVQSLAKPANLVSYHLKQLRQAQFVSERRSNADARDVYYSLDLAKLHQLYIATGEAIHPTLGADPQATLPRERAMPVRVLFLCTHNSARSQMAEGILRRLSAGRIEVNSAGSQPSHIHPLAVQVMEQLEIDISNQRSKHLNEFVNQSFDYVITVCDRARETCPVFPDDPERIHWSFPDPSVVTGTLDERRRAFTQTAIQLQTRLRYLLAIIEREKGL